MAPKSVKDAFETWLKQPRTDFTLREQFWLAFEAGATYALEKVKEAVKPDSSGATHE